VHQGTYNERPALRKSGTAEAGYINFVGNAAGGRAVVRGFEVMADYIRIIGFEITHVDTTFSRTILFSGMRTKIEILDNYIHHVYGEGGTIRAMNTTTSHIVVRGNEIDQTSCVPGRSCIGNGWAIQGSSSSERWLVEYNTFRRMGDFVNLYGRHHIIRNNYMHDFRNSHFPDGRGDTLHADFFQPGSDGPGSQTNHHVYESNLLGDNIELHSHILQMRNNTTPNNQYEILFRGNVAYNLGSYALMARGVHRLRHYNNVFYRMNQRQLRKAIFDYHPEARIYPSIGSHNFNNIISNTGGRQGGPFSISGASTLKASNNLCHSAGSHESCVSTADPLFSNVAEKDFTLLADSPAIGAGTSITVVTSPTGTGNSFDVEDSAFFNDGYGIAEGDIIRVGANAEARITAIASNTITLDKDVRWFKGDGVYWRNQDSSPDIGAYEYRKGGYGITITLNYTYADAARREIAITADVNDQSLVRFVEFWVDGIPVFKDYDAPYHYSWKAGGEDKGTHRIKAVARPLFAGSVLGYEAVADVALGAPPRRGNP
jgi:hypothetical protein